MSPFLTLGAAVVLAGAFAVAGEAFRTSGKGSTPPSIEALGMRVTPIAGDEFISRDEALRAARDVAGVGGDQPAEAYLLRATDETTAAIRDREVWLLVIGGFEVMGGAPVLADGSHAEPATYTTMYVFIDARSGEWLLSRLEE